MVLLSQYLRALQFSGKSYVSISECPLPEIKETMNHFDHFLEKLPVGATDGYFKGKVFLKSRKHDTFKNKMFVIDTKDRSNFIYYWKL